MTCEEFYYMLTLVEEKVRKQDIKIRSAIELPPVFLTVLASGESGGGVC